MARFVEESDFDFRHFRCCGDEDLYPFGCPECGRSMVFCYECDTLHGDLNDLRGNHRWEVNHFDPGSPIFSCPACGYQFEYYFIRDKRHKVSLDEWTQAGFGHLLESTVSSESKKATVDLGGGPIDLNAGMIEAVTNPPTGFTSQYEVEVTDVVSRLKGIRWFSQCGEPLSCDVSMDTVGVNSWSEAVELCMDANWENAQLEAQNQLTLWLHLHDRKNYQSWNDVVTMHKEAVVSPLVTSTLGPFQLQHNLDVAFVHSVEWDVLGALMENSFLSSGHRAFFFLELLTIYEYGHFPCGWNGDWPNGTLLVY